MKSLHKKLNLEKMWDISDQIHYELVTFEIRYKAVKGVQVKLGFVYSIREIILDKVMAMYEVIKI